MVMVVVLISAGGITLVLVMVVFVVGSVILLQQDNASADHHSSARHCEHLQAAQHDVTARAKQTTCQSLQRQCMPATCNSQTGDGMAAEGRLSGRAAAQSSSLTRNSGSISSSLSKLNAVMPRIFSRSTLAFWHSTTSALRLMPCSHNSHSHTGTSQTPWQGPYRFSWQGPKGLLATDVTT